MKIHCNDCHTLFRLDDKYVKPDGLLVRCSKCQSTFRVYPPQGFDRRKFPRTRTRNLIAHLSVDQNGKRLSQGMGKALDISLGGMLIETPDPIESGQISLMAVDKDNNLLEIKAKMVHCNETDLGKYRVGVKFCGAESDMLNFVTGLIKEYNYRKHSMPVDMSK